MQHNVCFIKVVEGEIITCYITVSWVIVWERKQMTIRREQARLSKEEARNSATNSEIPCGVFGVTGTGAWSHVHVRTYEDASRITVYR